MLRLLLLLMTATAFAAPRTYMPQSGFQDNFWQQVQVQHLQTQLQLQSQDQYRRQLLMQDQQRQIQQIQDQQSEINYLQRNSIMHEHSDRLRLYSRPIKARPQVTKKKGNR